MNKRILVILGHPVKDSLCGALAESYANGAKAAGNEVRFISLSDLSFDPIFIMGMQRFRSLSLILFMLRRL